MVNPRVTRLGMADGKSPGRKGLGWHMVNPRVTKARDFNDHTVNPREKMFRMAYGKSQGNKARDGIWQIPG